MGQHTGFAEGQMANLGGHSLCGDLILLLWRQKKATVAMTTVLKVLCPIPPCLPKQAGPEMVLGSQCTEPRHGFEFEQIDSLEKLAALEGNICPQELSSSCSCSEGSGLGNRGLISQEAEPTAVWG